VNESSRFTIKQVVLVFTDVVSSTALYEEAGDGPALDIVRDHFKVIFGAFASKGRIVKTVGDAVMGAFTNGEDAILAAADALDNLVGRVYRPDGTPLQVRIGIHCGAALVVPLNGINDYFGSTVNVAARVESKANDGECLVSETVLADPVAKATFDKMLAGGYVHSRDVELSLKGVGSAIFARGFRSKEKK
jgi:class 3 adenylate cyclase